jgi:hypothetical protein
MTYLPTSNDREVHGGRRIRAPHGLETLTLIPDNCAESLHSFCLDNNLRARKLVSDINRRQHLVIPVPKVLVKLLDSLIATVCDFMDGCEPIEGLYSKCRRRGTETPQRSSKMVMLM